MSDTDEWHDGVEGVETADDLVAYLKEYDNVTRVWTHTNPEDIDGAMPGREIIRFRMGVAKPVGYKIGATFRRLGFVHEYTDTSNEGSKFNPTRVIEQYWSRPANGAEAMDG